MLAILDGPINTLEKERFSSVANQLNDKKDEQ